MASKRRYSYKWRLFIPMIVILWGIIATQLMYQYRREATLRKETINKQLSIISHRLIHAYEHNTDMRQFMNFVGKYFDNSLFEEASVCVYDANTGELKYSAGLPVLQDFSESAERVEFREALNDGIGHSLTKIGSTMFYNTVIYSKDGRISVHTSMPYTVSIIDAISAAPDFWIIVLIMAVTVTAVCYVYTNTLTRNISLLRDFAGNAAEGKVNVDLTRFPHDELGDISRQIIKIYTEKIEAVTRSEKEHQIALHAVEEKARIKKELTNNINHELKTPIGVIKGYIDTVIATPDMDEVTRTRFLKRAQENVERLCNLLVGINDMNRLEDGSSNIIVTKIDFHELLFTLESDLRVTGLAGDMKFIYDLPIDCNIKGNASLLTGMVINLIKNAAQYSRGTEMGLKLVAENDKYYTFSFYDNGTGVAPEHIPHLFERFYRIDAGRSRKAGGTGLGLPIVKNTIEALGGTVTVRNRAKGGLEFLFTLEKWDNQQQQQSLT